jgi:hypothetical protein
MLGTWALFILGAAGPAVQPAAARGPDVTARATFTFPDGKVFHADLAPERSRDLWLSGKLVTEYRQVITPVDEGRKPHPSLQVIYDVRQYHDGQGRLDLTVENVLDVPAATKWTYDFALAVDGHTVRKRGVAHPWMTRWRLVQPLAGLQASTNRPNFESAYQAQALPRYLDGIAKMVRPVSGEKFDILQPADLTTWMETPGGRGELAPYPDWTASYLVYREPAQERYVLRNGDLAASWPVHVRNPNRTLVSLDQRPQYWLDGRWSPWHDGPAACNKMTDGAAYGPLRPDNAHQPSLAYVPYLVTGDRFYADEMKFWGNYGLLSTWPGGDAGKNREGRKGLLRQVQTRGVGWVVRNLADAAAYLPDDDPFKKYLAEKLTNNLKWLDEDASHPGPLGVNWHAIDKPDRPDKPQYVVSMWAHNYLAWAVYHTNRQGFPDGSKWCDMLVRFQLSLFNDPDYPRDYLAPYRLAVGVKTGENAMRPLATRAETAEQTRAYTDRPVPLQGFYGADARFDLMIAMAKGMPGAKKWYDWLEPRIHQDLMKRCGWAIAPYGTRKSAGKPLPNRRTFSRGWATFALVLPRGEVRGPAGLKVGDLETQNDVKCRWPDGSVKMVVLTALIPQAGEYSIHP